MDYQLPSFFPATTINIQVTRPEVYKAVSDLDKTLIGTADDYMGFAYFWDGSDTFKTHLRETTSWARKRVHDVLVHNQIPLLSQDRNEAQVTLAENIYRAYL